MKYDITETILQIIIVAFSLGCSFGLGWFLCWYKLTVKDPIDKQIKEGQKKYIAN